MTFTDYLLDFVFSAIPAVVFAIIFSTPVKYLPYVALGGSVAHIVRTVCINDLNIGIVGASFIASITISLMFIYLSPKLKAPRPVFTVASIVPIIPGKYAYLTLLSIIKMQDVTEKKAPLIESFFENGIVTTLVLLAIGMGIAMPALLFYRTRPVV